MGGDYGAVTVPHPDFSPARAPAWRFGASNLDPWPIHPRPTCWPPPLSRAFVVGFRCSTSDEQVIDALPTLISVPQS